MPTPQTARVTTAVSSNSNTFVDVTGLTFSVSASQNYYFRFVLHHSSSATTIGIRFAVNGPTAPTSFRVGGCIPISTVAQNFGSSTGYDTAIFASTTGTNINVMSIVEGVLVNGTNSGTLACRFTAETTAANACVVAVNSSGFLQQF